MGPWFDFLLACKSLNQINDIEERLKKIGTIFKFKGTKPTMEDLPTEGNESGDVWSVAGIEYVWAVNESGEGHWEPLGDIIDMDNYVMKADIVQQLGEAEDKIMSQKATKDAIQAYETSMFKELNKVKDYFYTVEYDNIDYAFANKYYETSNDPVEASGCSAVRNGNWYGRNFDWTYDESVDFLVRVPRTNTRYASMGIANGGSALNRQVVQSGIFSDDYRIIPFKVVDGINEKGLVVNSNVVPVDKDPTTGTVPRLEKRESLNMMMLVRYILDNFDDAKKAVEYIRDYVEVTPYAMLSEMGYELHLMVCDKEQSYVLEFAHNAVSIINVADKPYMTNFFLTDFTSNADGTVYTPATKDATHSAMITNGVTEHGDGLERYNLIVGNYASTATKAGMRALMNRLKYTRAYSTAPDVSSPYWYTEFVGGDLTVDSDVSAFASIVEKGGELFANRSRSKTSPYYGTWQSTHSCVYDIDEKKVYVIVQEDGQEMEYGFEFYYDAKEVDAIAEDINERIDDEVQTLNDKITAKGHYLGLWDAINGTCNTGLEAGTEYVPGDEFIIGEASAPKNMVVNGDFSVSSTAVPALFGWDITAWNALQSKRIEGGVAYVKNGNSDTKTIKQTVNNLIVGETYQLTAKLPYVRAHIVNILLDDDGRHPIATLQISENAQTFSVGIVATSTSHTITFSGTNAEYALTDVVLKSDAVPNYRPFGDTYTGVQKVEMESEKVEVNDSYLYDGTNWRLLKNVNEKIDVDADLNPDSTNPVQNKVVTAAIQGIEEEIDGLTKDLKGEILKIYFDPTVPQSGTGLSSNSPFKTSTEVWNLVSKYNGEIIISGSNTSVQNPLLFAQNLSNKIIKFESLYIKINDFCHISNCDIMVGYQSTLFRDAPNYRIGCTGNCGIYVNYQATISDTAAATSDYYCMFIGEIQNSPSLPCNITFTTEAPNCVINSNSRALINHYGEGNVVCNIHDNLTGSIKTLCEAGTNIPCTINICGNPSITKDSWTTDDRYAVINYAGFADLKGSSINVYLNSDTGNDSNTGLVSNSAIKTWSRLLEILSIYKNGKIRVNITGTLDMNISNQNVQLDNVDLELKGNVKTSAITYFQDMVITYHDGTWTGSEITYFNNCSFIAYTCTLNDDNISSNQPRFTVIGSRVYLGQVPDRCTLTSTNSYGLFYCGDLSSEFYLQHVVGTINYLCDYSGGGAKYGPVIYVYSDDITKTGYIGSGDSNGIVIYKGVYKNPIDLNGTYTTIWIDPQSGSDSSDGSTFNTPLKTFDRALQLINQMDNVTSIAIRANNTSSSNPLYIHGLINNKIVCFQNGEFELDSTLRINNSTISFSGSTTLYRRSTGSYPKVKNIESYGNSSINIGYNGSIFDTAGTSNENYSLFLLSYGSLILTMNAPNPFINTNSKYLASNYGCGSLEVFIGESASITGQYLVCGYDNYCPTVINISGTPSLNITDWSDYNKYVIVNHSGSNNVINFNIRATTGGNYQLLGYTYSQVKNLITKYPDNIYTVTEIYSTGRHSDPYYLKNKFTATDPNWTYIDFIDNTKDGVGNVVRMQSSGVQTMGSITYADRLHGGQKGSSTQPVYINDLGLPTACNLSQTYSLISETGSIIDLSIDEDTYKVIATLKDKDGNIISYSSEIDLPLEQVVVSISFDEETNTLTFTLKNGETTEVPLGSIITGLASQTWVQTNYYSKTESDAAYATKEALQEVADDLSALTTEVDTKASSADVETAITTVETSLAAETTRATGAEEGIAGNLTAEVARATAAEQAITASIPDISGLATKTELESAIEPLAVKEDVTEEIEIAVADKPTQTEMGEAISTAVSTKQETLVSGTNIKTVNGQSVLGSGNISIKTLSPMKDEWLEASTTEEAVEMIFDDGAQVGEGYLGTVLWGDLPGDLGGAECKAFVISDGIILFELNSADTPPYNWQYNSFAGEWRPLVEPTADGTTTLTVNGTEAGSWSANQEEDNTIELTIPTDYVTEQAMNTAIGEATTDMATNAGVTSAINTAISDKVTTNQMNTAISTATSGLATKLSVTDEQDRAISVEGTLSGRISALSSTVDNKANSSTVTTLSNTVSALTTTVNNKAGKDELPLHVIFYRYQGNPTCNVTYAELTEALDSNRPIIATYQLSNLTISGTITFSRPIEQPELMIGSFLSCQATPPKIIKITYNSDNTWTSETIHLATIEE